MSLSETKQILVAAILLVELREVYLWEVGAVLFFKKTMNIKNHRPQEETTLQDAVQAKCLQMNMEYTFPRLVDCYFELDAPDDLVKGAKDLITDALFKQGVYDTEEAKEYLNKALVYFASFQEYELKKLDEKIGKEMELENVLIESEKAKVKLMEVVKKEKLAERLKTMTPLLKDDVRGSIHLKETHRRADPDLLPVPTPDLGGGWGAAAAASLKASLKKDDDPLPPLPPPL
jgi:hypothetical protein